jgi:hypothetical protein
MSANVTFAVQGAGTCVPFLTNPPILLFGQPGSPLGPQVLFGGSGIAATAQAYWDGVEVPATSATSASIRIQPPAADLQTIGVHNLYVANGTVASSPVRVFIGPYLNSQRQPLSAYDPSSGRLYLLVSGTFSSPWDLVVMNAQTGVTLSTVPGIAGNLRAIALSSNGQYLYIAEAASATAGAPILRYNTAAGNVDFQWSLPSALDVVALATPGGSPGSLIVSQSNGIATIYDGATPRLFDSTIAGFAANSTSGALIFAGVSRVYVSGPSCWQWLDFDAFGFSGGQSTCGPMPPEVQQLGGVIYVSDSGRAAAFTFPGASAYAVLYLAIDPAALHTWSLSGNQVIDYNMAAGTMQTITVSTTVFQSGPALFPAGDGSAIVVGIDTVIRVP